MPLYMPVDSFADATKLKAIIHGRSGAGKSHLAATALNPLIVCCEKQALRTYRRVNPKAAVALVQTPNELREVLKELRGQIAAGTCPFDTVVLDSLTEMQRIFKSDKLSGSSETTAADDKKERKESLTMNEWGIIIDRTLNTARAFRDLDLHVLILTLSATAGEESAQRTVPSLNGKALPDDLAGLCQIEGYAAKKQGEDGRILHRVVFDGPPNIATKGDPDLDAVEVPYWPHWIARMFGADAPGARLLSDEEWEAMGVEPAKTPRASKKVA